MLGGELLGGEGGDFDVVLVAAEVQGHREVVGDEDLRVDLAHVHSLVFQFEGYVEVFKFLGCFLEIQGDLFLRMEFLENQGVAGFEVEVHGFLLLKHTFQFPVLTSDNKSVLESVSCEVL